MVTKSKRITKARARVDSFIQAPAPTEPAISEEMPQCVRELVDDIVAKKQVDTAARIDAIGELLSDDEFAQAVHQLQQYAARRKEFSRQKRARARTAVSIMIALVTQEVLGPHAFARVLETLLELSEIATHPLPKNSKEARAALTELVSKLTDLRVATKSEKKSA